MSESQRGLVIKVTDGESLQLNGPFASKLLLKLDSQRTGASLSVCSQMFARNTSLPTHRHLERDLLLFVHRGQGRVALDGQTSTVVSGVVVYVPRGVWCGIQNTGTGDLEVVWIAAAPGLQAFFRDLAAAGASADLAGLQAAAQRDGIELQTGGGAPTAAPKSTGGGRRRRNGRRRGRGRDRGGAAVQGQPSSAPPTAQPADEPPEPAAFPEIEPTKLAPAGPPPRRESSRRPPHQRPPQQQPPKPQQGARAKSGGRDRRPRRRGHVREVYMGGQWVRVTGDGPIIAPGKDRARSRSRSDRDPDGPSGPLTTPL